MKNIIDFVIEFKVILLLILGYLFAHISTGIYPNITARRQLIKAKVKTTTLKEVLK